MDRVSQCNKILQHFEERGSITSLEAVERYKILRCAARISDLRKKGFLIRTEMIYEKKPDGETCKYGRYWLESKELLS